MSCRRLGPSELQVSEVGVGGHHRRRDEVGGERTFAATAQEQAAVFSRALDRGINFFDTTSKEEVISFGDALRIMGRREEMVLCSMDEQYAALHADHLREYKKHTADELDRCLRWLGTDHIDVLAALLHQGHARGQGGQQDGRHRQLRAQHGLHAEDRGRVGCLGRDNVPVQLCPPPR